MTVPQLSPAPELTEAEKATVERFEAAPDDDASYAATVERIATAMWETRLAGWDSCQLLATAALAALRGDRGPLAGQHTTDEEAAAQARIDDSDTADELAAAGLRACCGQPSERHCQ